MKNPAFFEELANLESKFGNIEPELELIVRDHDLELEGYVVVWNTAISLGGPLSSGERGCGKGGTRISTSVSLEEIRILARTMAIKNAAAGLPMGGAKSGIKADPNEVNFEKKYRRFVELVKPILFENGGIFGGFGFDIGGKPEHALWACDQLQSLRSFTGKTVEMGGTDYDAVGIAGLGVVVAAETLLQKFNIPTNQASYAVQGLGAMGSAIIRYFSQSSAKLLAVADLALGGTYLLKQAASDQLLKYLGERDFLQAKKLLDKEGEFISSVQTVLESDVDVLFPAAIQNVINSENINKIKAKYIVEAANNPCSQEDRIKLSDLGITVIPDFIANPGGVIAAFVELTSTISTEDNIKYRAKVEEACKYTRLKIAENVSAVLELALEQSVPTCLAARYLALKRMFASKV